MNQLAYDMDTMQTKSAMSERQWLIAYCDQVDIRY